MGTQPFASIRGTVIGASVASSPLPWIRVLGKWFFKLLAWSAAIALSQQEMNFNLGHRASQSIDSLSSTRDLSGESGSCVFKACR